jgi:hypothetical protein
VFNEPYEDEVKHDPFQFTHDGDIPFSRLLSDPTVWQVQGCDNGDVNPNMPLLDDDVQVSDVTPHVIHAPMAPNQDTPCNQ